MTAFNDVLTAEKEAETAITTAQNEMTAVLASTQTAEKNRLEAETAKLEQAAASALATQEKKVTDLVGRIEALVQTEVVAVKKQFVAHKSDLKLSLKKHF